VGRLAPPRIELFERRTLSHRIRARLIAAFVMLVYGWKFADLQRSLKREGASLTRPDRRALGLRRRFVAGATAGYIASRYSLAEAAAPRINFIYADLCAAWSNFLITADAAMDTKGLSTGESRQLLRLSFDAMFGPVEARTSYEARSAISANCLSVFGSPYDKRLQLSGLPRDSDFRLERYAIRMASEIGKNIARLCDCPLAASFQQEFQDALQLFFTRTLDLMAGQLAALDQSRVDDEHDWGWYKEILQNKFTNVLLSPISLFFNPRARRSPEETMRECFRLINRNFFHRQVLDDLLDFDEDLSNHTANSLIYILVSQGRVAAAAQNNARGNGAAIFRELSRSGLLIPEFRIGLDCQVLKKAEWARSGEASCEPTVEALVRLSLTNRSSDKAMTFDNLLEQSLRRKTTLIDAWAKRDRRAVTEIVEQSGVASRILGSITAPENREIEQGLEHLLGDRAIREIMYVYYIHTLRTYQKCVQKWRLRGADPQL
jgi:hypothetical protein